MSEGSYQKENQEVLESLLQNMFFRDWEKEGENPKRGMRPKKTLELIISRKCNLACKYCYLKNFGHKLYPESIHKNAEILKNTEIILDWLIENEYNPTLELFSGEIFGQQIGFDVIDLIYDKYKKVPNDIRPAVVSIPTNFTFIQSNKLTEKVRNYRIQFKELGINFALSGSFDGKYMEENRPYINNLDNYDLDKPRDDEYYDKVFKFISETNSGLHPMIYSENIEKWQQNFLWFQKMMEKHGIPWSKLYLLQVRNAEWTLESSLHLKNFVIWLTEWTFNKVNRDIPRYINAMRAHPYAFNILKSIHGKPDRGLPCSIQGSLAVRLGDLKIVPCHRLMYPGQEYGQFNIEKGKINGVIASNVEMAIGVLSCDYRVQPYCVTCPIRDLCTGGCLGSQYEIVGDPFTPIPSTCMMQYALAAGIVEGLINIDAYHSLLHLATPEQKIQMEALREEILDYGI